MVYEYIPNGSPGDLLHGPKAGVDWHTREKIALGAAQGQAYLHHDDVPYIVYKDMKFSNIAWRIMGKILHLSVVLQKFRRVVAGGTILCLQLLGLVAT